MINNECKITIKSILHQLIDSLCTSNSDKWFSILGVSKNLAPVWYHCSVTLASRSKDTFNLQNMTWIIKGEGEIEG